MLYNYYPSSTFPLESCCIKIYSLKNLDLEKVDIAQELKLNGGQDTESLSPLSTSRSSALFKLPIE